MVKSNEEWTTLKKKDKEAKEAFPNESKKMVNKKKKLAQPMELMEDAQCDEKPSISKEKLAKVENTRFNRGFWQIVEKMFEDPKFMDLSFNFTNYAFILLIISWTPFLI